MSDYGIIIKNSAGNVQIDGNYRNYFYKEHGNTAGVISGGCVDIVDIPKDSQHPIFAWRPTTTFATHDRFLIGPHPVYTNVQKSCFRIASGSMTIYWMVFIQSIQQSLPTYGLIIRNSSNQVVFTSEEKYMKIIGVYTGSQTQGSTTNVTVQSTADNYFILTSPLTWKFIVAADPDYRDVKVRGMKKTSDTNIVIGDFTMSTLGITSTASTWVNAFTLIEVNK